MQMTKLAMIGSVFALVPAIGVGCAGRHNVQDCTTGANADLGDGGKPLAPKIVSPTAVESRWSPDGKVQIEILNSGKNAFVGRLTIEAGAALPKYVDETEEYLHVIDGKGEITISGQSWEIGPGDTIFVPAGATVLLRNWDRALVLIQVISGPGPAKKYEDWSKEPPTGASPKDTVLIGTMPGT